MTLGSLFDGSGGFPLAGVLNGIEPRWLAEIEPYPCRVTTARFPNVPNLGDVTKINGAEIEPVDIITFGSPCQDLSVAGQQKGIHDGERSSLFFDAIRIIKEMRAHDFTARRPVHLLRPRFAVWENVPGAFSSNHGEDFRAVLQAFCEVAEGLGVSVPQPPKGKWFQSGCIVGDGWSLAWRVYDAQYWGVPQRRKRIYLIADFGSECAGEILFESESVRGDSEESGTARKGIAADAERSAGGSGVFGVDCRNASLDPEHTHTLQAKSGGGQSLNCTPSVLMQNTGRGWWNEGAIAETIRTPCGGDSTKANLIVEPSAFMGGQGAKARSIAYCDDGSTPTLKSVPSGGNTIPDVVYCLQGNGIDRAATSKENGAGWREQQSYTLNIIDRPAVCFRQNQREEVRDTGLQSGAITAESGMHNSDYICYSPSSFGCMANGVGTLRAHGNRPGGGNIILQSASRTEGNQLDETQ